jgi:hypothetical protein
MDPINLTSPGNATGAMDGGDVAALQKALTAGYGTDVSQLTGGGALRIQSLDTTMQATIQENKHFRLFNALPKPTAGATVDEWTEQNGVGGFLGGSSNSELGVIAQSTGSYNRRVGQVKYLMTQRSVSFVQSLQNTITDSEAVEYSNGALQLLTDAEYLCFEGDSTVVPTEFDGIYAQMVAGVATGQVDGANVMDANGQSLSSVNLFNKAAATIASRKNFGTPTDFFCSFNVQADLDTGLDPAFRVPLTDVSKGGIELGSPVVGIRTSHGNIASNPDTFIRDSESRQPFELEYNSIALSQVGIKPASVAGVAAADVASNFGAAQAGLYYYLVTGTNAAGQSTGLISAQVAVAAGQSVTLTIGASAGKQETGYVIYRSRLNGTGTVAGTVAGQGSDFREMLRIPASGLATTVYVDQNRDIPGTTKAYILNMARGATAITWRQLLPMIKFALYPTNQAIIPWAQMLFGYLRISKRRHHVVIKNILPANAVWRPFNV